MVRVKVRMRLESGDYVDIEASNPDGGEAFCEAMETYWQGLGMMAHVSEGESTEDLALVRARKESAN